MGGIYMKFTKIALSALFVIILAGCQQETPAESSSSAVSSSVVESSSSVETSSQAVSISSAESVSSSVSSEVASSETPDETTVKFTFHVNGQEVGSYNVKDAVGKSVLDAMSSNPEIKFIFNESDGVIDNMFDTTNDYAAGKTWVYLLNDQMAELGVVSQTLSAGDKIDWYYGTVDELPITIIPASE